MKALPQSISAIIDFAWNAEFIWIAEQDNHLFVFIKPLGFADEALANRLGFFLAEPPKSPHLDWREVWRNTPEED
jgi:hypothetical protein